MKDFIERVASYLKDWSCLRCKFFQGFNRRGYLHCEHLAPGEDRDDKWGADYDCRGEKYAPARHGIYVTLYFEADSYDELKKMLGETIKSLDYVKEHKVYYLRLEPPRKYNYDPVRDTIDDIIVKLGVIPSHVKDRIVHLRSVIRGKDDNLMIIYKAWNDGDVCMEYDLIKNIELDRNLLDHIVKNAKHFTSIKAVMYKGKYWVEYIVDKEGSAIMVWERKGWWRSFRTPFFL